MIVGSAKIAGLVETTEIIENGYNAALSIFFVGYVRETYMFVFVYLYDLSHRPVSLLIKQNVCSYDKIWFLFADIIRTTIKYCTQ